QTSFLSANLADFSAKLLFYQPISLTFQPNFCFISQTRWLFAKLLFYQPISLAFQLKSNFFSQHQFSLKLT
ncbi:hypothetical protein, partial [Niallia circulans]|uniref:hypothetical protein n=1 Tax=Niallia circulans TaxID=1397 RepID=UPI001C52FC43